MAEVQNNKDNVPAKHYAEIYHDANPLEISVRTAVPYDEARKVFLFTLMNSVYEITHPDFSVRFGKGFLHHVAHPDKLADIAEVVNMV